MGRRDQHVRHEKDNVLLRIIFFLGIWNLYDSRSGATWVWGMEFPSWEFTPTVVDLSYGRNKRSVVPWNTRSSPSLLSLMFVVPLVSFFTGSSTINGSLKRWRYKVWWRQGASENWSGGWRRDHWREKRVLLVEVSHWACGTQHTVLKKPPEDRTIYVLNSPFKFLYYSQTKTPGHRGRCMEKYYPT